ncbi:MAG: hypothetical protein V8R14_06355 [Clostridia bacterium]
MDATVIISGLGVLGALAGMAIPRIPTRITTAPMHIPLFNED